MGIRGAGPSSSAFQDQSCRVAADEDRRRPAHLFGDQRVENLNVAPPGGEMQPRLALLCRKAGRAPNPI
jgi:hypothetical protein